MCSAEIQNKLTIVYVLIKTYTSISVSVASEM